MTPGLQARIAPQVRTMQVVVLGLAASPLAFAAITHFLPMRPIGADAANVLAKVALLFGLAVVCGHEALGALVRNQAVRSLVDRGVRDPERLAGAYLSGLMISSALAEGAAFLCLLAYWTTRDPWTMGMAALLVALNLRKYPNPQRVAAWVEGLPVRP